MEDLSELFKRHFNLLHKGTTITKSVQDRKEIHNNARKAKRDTLAFLRRHIDKNLSPVNSPTPRNSAVIKNKIQTTNNTQGKIPVSAAAKSKPEEVSKRFDLLQKWKTEKAKQKEREKAKAKPLFKVCHVSSDMTTNIDKANKVIKGKPIFPKSQFAPANHKFQPPKGIEPLSFNASTTQQPAATTSGRSKLKFTPQAKTGHNHVNKKPLPACLSNSSKESVKQKPRTSKHVPTPKENKEKSAKPNTRNNFKETSKPDMGKFNKDKGDGLIEVKKKTPSASENSKTSTNSRSNYKSKKEGTNNTSSLKPSTSVPTRQVQKKTTRAAVEKTNNAKAPVQKTPKKTVGWSVKNNESANRTSDGDAENKITYRKTPKKSELVLNNDQRDFKTSNINISVDTIVLDDTSEESPKNNSVNLNITQQKMDNSLNSDVFVPSTQPVESHKLGSCSSTSTDYSVDYNNLINTSQSSVCTSDYKTPPPVYVSPFVTISRGKSSARKEYHIRKSQGKGDFDENSPEVMKILTAHTSPKAGAAYFKYKLDREIQRIFELCKKWEKCLEDPDLPEEAHSSIDVTIGQSKLLISKKFQQFLGLIAQCETKNFAMKPVTCEDLHGFWDMLYMQVEDLDKRFLNLQTLKDNNWKEILPQKVAPVKKSRGRPKKAQTKSKLVQIIQEARKKQKEQPSEDINLVDLIAKEVKTPLKGMPQEEMNSTHRKSLRLCVVNRENKSRCSSSPGLTMMKISQSIKQGDGFTPVRSILKTDVFRSTGKKSVVFIENSPKPLCKTNLFNEQEKENISDNLINCSPAPLTPRRSSRISKLKM